MLRMMQLEREVKACDYICEIYSHGNVYGFCTYVEDEGIKQSSLHVRRNGKRLQRVA